MREHRKAALLCGMLGCLCYGGGDWLMMYGDPAHAGALIWLTAGTAQIPLWRYNLAMALAFPGILLYGIALFAVETYIKTEMNGRSRKAGDGHYSNDAAHADGFLVLCRLSARASDRICPARKNGS